MCIGLATIIEKYRGTDYVSHYIYGAWWFVALWGLLTVASLAHIMRQRLYKRLALMLLHGSFVVILAGALTTHLFARSGRISLRTGTTASAFIDKENKVHPLPFNLTLKEFRIVNYPGTDAPLDYQSILSATSLSDGHEDRGEVLVSMNNIGHVEGYRLFQQSYDADGEGVTLGVSYDPYGIAITYVGYLLLLLGILATLLSRHTQLRRLLRNMSVVLLLFFFHSTACAAAPQTVDRDIAHRMGTVNVLYNNRICPLNTVATDFVAKLSGSASWNGYSADEIFLSWMIYYSPWEQQQIIRIKSKQVQQLLGISSQWASYADFLNAYHEYKLQDYIQALRTGRTTLNGFDVEQNRKGLLEADEKFHLIEMFYRGQFTRLFPYPETPSADSQPATVNWYTPGAQSLPRAIPVKEQFFIKQSMDFLTESIVTGQRERAFEIIAKIKLFQREMIGDLLPSASHTRAELFYNALRSQKWPVFLALTLGLLFAILSLLRQPAQRSRSFAFAEKLTALFHASLFLYVTLQLALRWWLSGHVPVSNGPETMLFMAWVLLLVPVIYLLIRKKNCTPTGTCEASLGKGQPAAVGTCEVSLDEGQRVDADCRRQTVTLQLIAFPSLLASFCLLVAMLGGTNSQLTPLMPVLQSPLLSIHVMTVMCAYALFALQMLMGIQAIVQLCKRDARCSPETDRSLEHTTALSQLMLYPAVFLLAIGIFLGAVWANVSWGNYWSWDPKESWALITLMVYAVPFHRSVFNIYGTQGDSRRAMLRYHVYIVAAFLFVIITYFGVNYFLSGMHSYA